MADSLSMLISAANLIDSTTAKPPPGSLEDLRHSLNPQVYQLLAHKSPIFLLRTLTFYKQYTLHQSDSAQSTTTTTTDNAACTPALCAALVGACRPFLRSAHGLSLLSVTSAAGVPLTEVIAPLRNFITRIERSGPTTQGNVLREALHYDIQLGSVWRHMVRCDEAVGMLRRLVERCENLSPEERSLRMELCWVAFLVAQRENREMARSMKDGPKRLLSVAAYYFLFERNSKRCVEEIPGINEGSLSLTKRQSYQTCQGFDPLVQEFFNDVKKSKTSQVPQTPSSHPPPPPPPPPLSSSPSSSSSSPSSTYNYKELLNILNSDYQKRMPRDFDERVFLLDNSIIGSLGSVPQHTVAAYNVPPQYQPTDVTNSGYLLHSPLSSPLGTNSTPRPVAATPSRTPGLLMHHSATPHLRLHPQFIPGTPRVPTGVLASAPPSTPMRRGAVGAAGALQQTPQVAPPGTPGRAAFAGVAWLAGFVDQQQQQQQQKEELNGPGVVLQSLGELYEAEDRVKVLERMVERLVRENPGCEKLCRPDQRYVDMGEMSKESTLRAILGNDHKTRLDIVQKMFYCLFDSLLSREFYVIDEDEIEKDGNNNGNSNGNMDGNGNENGRRKRTTPMRDRIVSVLSRELLVRSILAFSVETVGHAVKASEAAFPAVLKCFGVPPFEFFRISMNISALGVALPNDIMAHFRAAEEAIVDMYSWEKGSRVLELYDAAAPSEILRVALAVLPLSQQQDEDVVADLLKCDSSNADRNDGNRSEDRDPMHHGFSVLIRKFFSIMARKLEFCENFLKERKGIEQRVWFVLILIVAKHKELLKHRHGTQLLLCAVHACSEASQLSQDKSESFQRMVELMRIPRTACNGVEIDAETGARGPLAEFYARVFLPAAKELVDTATKRFPVPAKGEEDSDLQLPRQVCTTPLIKKMPLPNVQQSTDTFGAKGGNGGITWKTPWSSTKGLSSSSISVRNQNYAFQNTPMKGHQNMSARANQPQPRNMVVINPLPVLKAEGSEGQDQGNLQLKRPATPPKRKRVDNYIDILSPTPNKKRILSKRGPVELCSPEMSTKVPTNREDPLLLNSKIDGEHTNN